MDADDEPRILKRTRPIKACQACRAKKVKCNLKPDEPVCEQCAASGKPCLFRIDDLDPTLRRERFAAYGPPGENARVIGSKKARVSRPKSSTSNNDSVRAPLEDPSVSSFSRAKTEATEADGLSGSPESGSDDKSSAKPKSKANFRSWANPTNLAAPSTAPQRHTRTVSTLGNDAVGASAIPGVPESSLQSGHYMQRANRLPTEAYPTGTHPEWYGHGSSGSLQAPSVLASNAAAHPSLTSHHRSQSHRPASSAGPGHSAYTDHVGLQIYGNERTSHSRSTSQTGGQNSQSGPLHLGEGLHHHLPSFRSAFSGVEGSSSNPKLVGPPLGHGFEAQRRGSLAEREVDPAGVHHRSWSFDRGSDTMHGLNASSPGNRWTAFSSARSPAISANPNAPSPMSWAINTFGPGATPGGAYSHGTPPFVRHSHSPSNSAIASLSVHNAVTHRQAGQSPRNAFETIHSSGKHVQLPSLVTDAKTRNRARTLDVSRSPLPCALTSGAGSEQNAGRNRAAEEGESSEVSPSEAKPPIFSRRIALPFFRWFGATANTPGMRRIKVGVYHESDIDAPGESAAPTPANKLVGLPRLSSADEVTSAREAAPANPDARDASSDKAFAGSPAMSPPIDAARWQNGTHTREESRQLPNHIAPESTVSASARLLFEADRPRYPRGDLLHGELIPLFIKHFKCNCFPWLNDAELTSQALSGELPAILANAICAVAARFSTRQELVNRGAPKSRGDAFAEMAKTLLIPMLSWPSIDVVETLVILSYAEFGAGADAGLWMYVGMALRMATDLGLQYEATIASMSTERQRDRARWLFWSVVCLDRITCFGTGRPVTIREDTFDCEMPKLYDDPSSDFYVAGHIVRTLMRRGRIGDLLNRPPTRTKDESSAHELGQRLSAMWIDLVEYHDSMPADLRFSVQTFRRAAQAGQGSAFVYLHVLLQSTMSLLNRPSLMRRFEGISQAPPTKLSAIARHAAETITSMLRFADDQGRSVGESELSFNPYLDTNPYLDQLILPCGRAFLSEREDVREALRRLGCAHGQGTNSRPESRHGERAAESEAAWGPLLSSRQYAEAHLKSCQMVLDRLAIYWGGAAWPARAMEQESAGGITDTIDPDARDEDAQPAPVRDLEMVLTWARRKARVRRARAGTRTPGASRRPSIAPGSAADAAGQSADQDGAIDVNAALSGQGAEASAFGDNGTTGSLSPLGLGFGFSGTIADAADIDLQALISAWATEQPNNFGMEAHNASHASAHYQPAQDWNPVPPLTATHDGAYAQYTGHHPHHGVASSNDAVNFGQNGIVGDVNDLGLSAIEAMQLEELLSAGAPGGDGEVFPMDLLSEDVSPSLYNEMPPALFNTFRLGAPSTMVPSQRANTYDANAQRQYQRPS
ncbi:hypothetical protein IE81DRAFT_344419 [Ceraceosorus guamensis]|uniref:Zn(2)-C6 fungal-type domain-containing protein n=1 Tax=Ceraceosorus guamensis TaxID=1522189 RepID=A0A316W8Q3_9BASI|nr:hypothetical protein IE81DRAFT_344419 [Ceraceosorus guamensis]PWN45944.1 hypothetical protein IE81DRAFT_344419 [Ceraceosorus guamensis]